MNPLPDTTSLPNPVAGRRRTALAALADTALLP